MKISLKEGIKVGDILLLGGKKAGYEVLRITSLKGNVLYCDIAGLPAPRYLDGELFCRNGVTTPKFFRGVEFTIEGDFINLTGSFGNIVGFCSTPEKLSEK